MKRGHMASRDWPGRIPLSGSETRGGWLLAGLLTVGVGAGMRHVAAMDGDHGFERS